MTTTKMDENSKTSKRSLLSNQYSPSAPKHVPKRRMNPIEKFSGQNAKSTPSDCGSQTIHSSQELRLYGVSRMPLSNLEQNIMSDNERCWQTPKQTQAQSFFPLTTHSHSSDRLSDVTTVTPKQCTKGSLLTNHFATSSITGQISKLRRQQHQPSPSARRLSNVDLSGISCHRSTRPTSNESVPGEHSQIKYQLPTSTVSRITNPCFIPSSEFVTKAAIDVGSTSGCKNLINRFNDVSEFPKDTERGTSIDEGDKQNEEDDTYSIPSEYLSDDNEDDFDMSYEDLWSGYMTLGGPDKVCSHCKAVMWDAERNNKSTKYHPPTFSMCCKNGQIQLPPERQPPPFLANLLSGGDKTAHYKKNIRIYNSMYAFTSLGGKIDNKINRGRAPYTFKLSGQNYHLIGSICPVDGETPKYCQLYVYDTENELENRKNAIPGSDSADPDIIQGLLLMLDENNKLVHGFRMARDRFRNQEPQDIKLLLVSSSSASGRPNTVGPSNEVGALIVGDLENTCGWRDIVVQKKNKKLKRIFETNVHFMQLQYPLLFPQGDDGFHLKIPLKAKSDKAPMYHVEDPLTEEERQHRLYVSMREYYAYKLMIRPNEGLTPHLSGRLWQQYIVDAFTAVDQYRLDWVKTHQKTIRSDLYKSIRDSLRKGDSNPSCIGKNVILPATFTGSKRYMSQYFKDSLAICRSIGHPSFFLTMTCNTKWPEIQHMVNKMPGVTVYDAPDVIARVFKMKLDQLVDLIKNKNYFGRCIGVMHVIEFQKRGLPHAHMLVWLHPEDRPKSIEQIDELISAEIPDRKKDPIGYHAVKNYMIHGPCGQDFSYSPCMSNGKCTRHFPKRYNGHTFFDDCGFPVYRRRNMNTSVVKNKQSLDNRFVVPYSRDLLLRFQCHINLEVCNNSRSLKYLFKYCLKGHDTATMLLKRKKGDESTNSDTNKKPVDEVKHYLDGRYVCASEAAWRILGFDIHYRYPSVERLPVHVPGEKHVTFSVDDNLEEVAAKANSKKSKLEAWFIANKTIPSARDYTYQEFPKGFTWQPGPCKWKIRERGIVIGRLTEVHASSGDNFYLRMLLMRNKGAQSFKDLRTIDNRVYGSFKEACDALGLLQDDKQWDCALRENAESAMPQQIRSLFVNILTNSPVADPLKLWKEH